jgi:hypothetical protein
MNLVHCTFRKPRFSLTDIAGLIALAAVTCRWPFLAVPSFSIVLVILLERAGVSLVGVLLITIVVGFLLGVVMAEISLR